jgi:hypothetical protein
MGRPLGPPNDPVDEYWELIVCKLMLLEPDWIREQSKPAYDRSTEPATDWHDRFLELQSRLGIPIMSNNEGHLLWEALVRIRARSTNAKP